jgi:hypothetical protein
MKINQNKITYIYFFLYLSMYLGFFYNEDFAFGTIRDYLVHIDAANLMRQDIFGTFLKYDHLKGGAIPHSPIYIFYFMSIQNFLGGDLSRLINMHFILLIPYFSYLSLKLKFNINKNDLKNLLPAIFFISPYFRSGALWIDDNILGLTFLSISFYFYLKFENSKNKDTFLIFFNVLFIALAAYFRPIYCIFGVYFFLNFFLHLKLTTKFFYYIAFNVILSAPAFYYIVILGINEWFSPWLFRTNNITTFSLALSLIFFYSIPFILFNFDKLKIIIYEKKTIFFSIIYLIILTLNFNYLIPYSGGIFYKLSNFLFSNNYLFYLSSFLSFYLLFFIFKNFVIKSHLILDLTLLTLLILMEIDGVIYHEAYDPLFYILSFLIFKNSIYSETIKNLSIKSLSYLFIFGLTFLIMSVIKTYIHQQEMLPYLLRYNSL